MDKESRFELDTFMDRAQNFLEAALPRRERGNTMRVGDRLTLLEDRTSVDQEQELAAIRQWRRREFDAGFGWVDGPTELNGGGSSAAHTAAYRRLRSQFVTPPETMLGVSLGMVTPTIEEFGTPAAKHRYLEGLHRADLVACQLFSEPGAGSDLGSISTRATRDRDGWRITGQKVWSSGAHYSDIGEALCRTGDTMGRDGLSMFIVDMRSPGVVVRPLRQMSGGAAFNEVFLDDVFVADDHVLGEVGDGWRVAMATLNYERQSIGGGGDAGRGGANFDRVLALARRVDATSSPIVRQSVAELYTNLKIARWTTRRLLATRASSAATGSIGKLSLTANQRRISDLAAALLGTRLVVDSGEPDSFEWSEYVMTAPGVRVAGGTDEIQRNVLGERVLGLPRDQRGAITPRTG